MNAPMEVDPALVGRELGPWTMLSPWVTVPSAVAIAGILVWYFAALSRRGLPRSVRRVRRIGIAFALAALVPLVRATSFVHPHEDRMGWAVAWGLVVVALAPAAFLAVVDAVLVTRAGVRDLRALRRETLGGRARADG